MSGRLFLNRVLSIGWTGNGKKESQIDFKK